MRILCCMLALYIRTRKGWHPVNILQELGAGETGTVLLIKFTVDDLLSATPPHLSVLVSDSIGSRPAISTEDLLWLE